ncbi:hypothetical protein CcI6DRAFT_04737, partial [Frankia sp. CcI6]
MPPPRSGFAATRGPLALGAVRGFRQLAFGELPGVIVGGLRR